MKFISDIVGKPLEWINSLTGNFALSVVLFLVLCKFLLSFLTYFKSTKVVRTQLAKPFLFKIKEKFLGKDNEKFQNGSLKIFSLTKTSQFSTTWPTIVELFFLFPILTVLYNPITYVFKGLSGQIDVLYDKASKIVSAGLSKEIDIINAIRTNPTAFSDVDTTPILDMNTNIFGFDIFKPADIGGLSVVLPILMIVFFLYRTIKLIVPVLRKKVKLRKVVLPLSLNIIICSSMSVAAFTLPMIFYLYFVVFTIVGLIGEKVINAIIMKRYKDWVKETNTKCQEVLRDLGVEEKVSAILEKESDEDVQKENN